MNCDSIVSANREGIIQVINNTLKYIDPRLVNHGKRVAYIVLQLFAQEGSLPGLDLQQALILSVFHDIGAFKTDEIDRMVDFETNDVWNHSIYGYLFLKNTSPLGEAAEAILYHHLPWRELQELHSPYGDYASVIALADRVDILLHAQGPDCDLTILHRQAGSRFDPRLVELFFAAAQDGSMIKTLMDGGYHQIFTDALLTMDVPSETVLEYLKMLVYSIDFRSEVTVAHTINTTAISDELGKLMGFSPQERLSVYFGALIHDLGKIAVPVEILESQERLSPKEMEIMRTHVEYTQHIIEGLLNDEICQIAIRHHEKLDGSGYPYGLTGEVLTPAQRTVAVADVLSALTNRRSYKDAFPKETVLGILTQMRDQGKLCPQVCNLVLEHFDQIMAHTDTTRDPVLQMYARLSQEYDQLIRELARTGKIVLA